MNTSEAFARTFFHVPEGQEELKESLAHTAISRRYSFLLHESVADLKSIAVAPLAVRVDELVVATHARSNSKPHTTRILTNLDPASLILSKSLRRFVGSQPLRAGKEVLPTRIEIGRAASTLEDFLFIIQSRHVLFGDPVSLRYEYNTTTIQFVLKRIGWPQEHFIIAVSDEGSPIGFVAVFPLTDEGRAKFLGGEISGYDLVLNERYIARHPNDAVAVVVPNYINTAEGTHLSNMALMRLNFLVSRSICRSIKNLDPNRGPHVVATGRDVRGRHILKAFGFQSYGTTMHGFPLWTRTFAADEAAVIHAIGEAS